MSPTITIPHMFEKSWFIGICGKRRFLVKTELIRNVPSCFIDKTPDNDALTKSQTMTDYWHQSINDHSVLFVVSRRKTNSSWTMREALTYFVQSHWLTYSVQSWATVTIWPWQCIDKLCNIIKLNKIVDKLNDFKG